MTVLLCVTLAATAVLADPVVTVTDGGINGSSNREWLVEVAPDPALFSATNNGTGGSLAVELALEVTGSDLLTATKNGTDWPYDNPGNNPFTLGVTEGLVVDLSGDTAFAALGSEFFTTGDSVAVLTIETLGSGATTLSWGGQTLLANTPEEYTGSRVAQSVAGDPPSLNFDGIMGDLTLGLISGDYNNSGQVEQGDLDLVLLNWGQPWPPEIFGWINEQPTDDGVVDQNDLDGVLLYWGNTAVPVSRAVPEPACALMLTIGGFLMGRLRRNTRASIAIM